MRSSRTRSPLLLAAVLFALAACSREADGPAATDAGAQAECAARADCLAMGEEYRGLVCGTSGRCERCASDGQCELREQCDPESRRCVFKPGWGDACALNADCMAGERCVQGLCVAELEATPCVDGECLAQGLRCNRVNGVCEEDLGCLADGDCAQSELCNLPTHLCVARCTEETAAERCAAGELCVEGRCSQCADSTDCSGGLVCDLEKLQCVSDGAARCLSDRDCPVELSCNQATGFCTTDPPPCRSDEDCLSDERCELATGRCLARTCQPDRWEPNGQLEGAPSLAAGTWSGMTLCAQEQDWYALALARGDRVNVFVEADPLLEGRFETTLSDARGGALASGGLALAYTVATEGAYYLRFAAVDAWVEYGLRISISKGEPCDSDRLEPNDLPAQAAPLAAGETDGLTVCGSDVDLFSLPVPAGSGARIELHYLPTEGDLDLVARSADGAVELARSATLDPVEAVELSSELVGGTSVLVEVSSEDARAHGGYWLRVAWTP